MTVSMRKALAVAEAKRDLDQYVTITLVSNLKPGDEFDLREVPVYPEGYRLIVRAVAPEPGETELVKVFFEEVPGHQPKPARMNGNFPVQVIRRPKSAPRN